VAVGCPGGSVGEFVGGAGAVGSGGTAGTTGSAGAGAGAPGSGDGAGDGTGTMPGSVGASSVGATVGASVGASGGVEGSGTGGAGVGVPVGVGVGVSVGVGVAGGSISVVTAARAGAGPRTGDEPAVSTAAPSTSTLPMEATRMIVGRRRRAGATRCTLRSCDVVAIYVSQSESGREPAGLPASGASIAPAPAARNARFRGVVRRAERASSPGKNENTGTESRHGVRMGVRGCPDGRPSRSVAVEVLVQEGRHLGAHGRVEDADGVQAARHRDQPVDDAEVAQAVGEAG